MEQYLHSPYAFMVWCLVKHRDFTFYFAFKTLSKYIYIYFLRGVDYVSRVSRRIKGTSKGDMTGNPCYRVKALHKNSAKLRVFSPVVSFKPSERDCHGAQGEC
jgi:hypothetical protein